MSKDEVWHICRLLMQRRLSDSDIDWLMERRQRAVYFEAIRDA